MSPRAGFRTDQGRSRNRAALAPLIGALLLVACQTAEDNGASPSSAAEPSEAAAPSVAAATPAPVASEDDEAASDEVTVTVSETSVGPALAGEDGLTLYVLFGDSEDGSGCIGPCEDAWPPFIVDEATEVVAADDVSGEIGTTTRPDGSTQVTLNTRPLYYYVGDSEPGDANGHELNDVWFVAEQ